MLLYIYILEEVKLVLYIYVIFLHCPFVQKERKMIGDKRLQPNNNFDNICNHGLATYYWRLSVFIYKILRLH